MFEAEDHMPSAAPSRRLIGHPAELIHTAPIRCQDEGVMKHFAEVPKHARDSVSFPNVDGRDGDLVRRKVFSEEIEEQFTAPLKSRLSHCSSPLSMRKDLSLGLGNSSFG
jgi:hypothetical protein